MNSQSLLLTSPKNAEQCEDRPEALQFVSRRRMAFRPQSLKKILPQISKTDVVAAEGSNSSTVQEVEKPPAIIQQQFNTPINEADKSRRILWTLPEQVAFYEALKIHGKEFEAIRKFMEKRKMNKDKEQIRNYYLNTFKLWRGKAQIDESEWANIPRDSRELFVLINGCEWRKRLEFSCGTSFDQQKFKQLILDGIVSFRPKRKKFIVTIRTPYCPALLKYFPYEKRGADIPTHIDAKLKPLRNHDREYVSTLCEQNPFLQLHINVNDKISTIFEILGKKWQPSTCRFIDDNNTTSNIADGIKLFVDADTQVRKIRVGVDEENSPVLSLNRLKKDFESKQAADENPERNLLTEETTIYPVVSQKEAKSGVIPASMKEMFEITEEKIRLGLTKINVSNASILQLFYLLGMNNELIFNYEIDQQNFKLKPWELFISLVNRDYDELMAKSSINPLPSDDVHSQTTTTTTTRINVAIAQKNNKNNQNGGELQQQQQPKARTMAQEVCKNHHNIVEEENMQFIRQIRAQTTHPRRQQKRQIKLVHDEKKIFNRVQAQLPMVAQTISHSSTRPLPSFIIQNGVVIQVNKHGVDTNTTILSTQIPPPTDVHFVQPAKRIHSGELTENPMAELNSEISLDSAPFSPFQSVILDNSPNKSLPEDVRSAMSEMMKESSVDYCRKFEKLTRMHQEGSPAAHLPTTSRQDYQQMDI